MDSIEFGNAVYMNYVARSFSGDIPPEVSGSVLGLFKDFYHKVFVGRASAVHDLPGTPYEGDVNQCVDRLLDDPRTVGIAVLDGAILEHLKRTGNFEVKNGNPVGYKRAGRTFHIF